MATKFSPGDTVRLKSGGPVMTVMGDAQNPPNLLCKWFTSTIAATASHESFSPASLELSPPVPLPGFSDDDDEIVD